jgi:inner membrane protein
MRRSLKRLGLALGRDLSPLAIIGCGAVLFLADWAYQRAGDSFFPGGPLDETAHLLTALLLLQVLPVRLRTRIAVPALIGSVAIDLDHVPQYLGDNFLTVGTPRPYTHSLLTLLVLLLLALAVRRRRNLFLGLAVGVMLHFFRDLAEGNGSGVALLWPLRDHAFSYPHSTYLVLMACVVVAEVCLAGLRPKLQSASA